MIISIESKQPKGISIGDPFYFSSETCTNNVRGQPSRNIRCVAYSVSMSECGYLAYPMCNVSWETQLHSSSVMCQRVMCKQCNSRTLSLTGRGKRDRIDWLAGESPFASSEDNYFSSLCMVNTINNNITRACIRHKYGSFMFIISISWRCLSLGRR